MIFPEGENNPEKRRNSNLNKRKDLSHSCTGRPQITSGSLIPKLVYTLHAILIKSNLSSSRQVDNMFYFKEK